MKSAVVIEEGLVSVIRNNMKDDDGESPVALNIRGPIYLDRDGATAGGSAKVTSQSPSELRELHVFFY